MVRPEAGAAIFVERFFQFSVLGLVTCGYLAVASSGYLDAPTLVLAGAGLLFRGLVLCGLVRIAIPERVATAATLFYSAFFVADCFVISKAILPATVHLVFFIAVVRILTARRHRDDLTIAAVAFLELVAAAILSIGLSFFVCLAVYLVFAMAALTSGEIRRSIGRSPATARSGLRRFHPRLALLSGVHRGGHPGAYGGAVLHSAAHRRRGFRAAALASRADTGLCQRSGAGRGGRN